MNEHTRSRNINISQQPTPSSTEPAPTSVTVPVTFPVTTGPAPSKTNEISIAKVLAIIAGVFFLVGSGLYLLAAILD